MLFFLISGCVSYKRFYVDADDFYRSKKIKTETYNYDFYIHDVTGQQYRANSPQLTDSVFIAELVKIENVANPERLLKTEETEMRNDIHLFLDDTIKLNPSNRQIELPKQNVRSASLNATNGLNATKNPGSEKTGTIFLLVVLGIVSLIYLIYLIGTAIAKATVSTGNAVAEGIIDSACYIATMAYGSYDAPEVMVLRRFRDEKLLTNWWGKAFVKFYYATSPHLVKLLKNVGWVNSLIRKILDKFILRLKKTNGW